MACGIVQDNERNVHDTKKFGPLLKESAMRHDIDKVYADKAYDNRKNFNILDESNAEPTISIRKNASTRSIDVPRLTSRTLMAIDTPVKRCGD